jgi:hypothetical protein
MDPYHRKKVHRYNLDEDLCVLHQKLAITVTLSHHHGVRGIADCDYRAYIFCSFLSIRRLFTAASHAATLAEQTRDSLCRRRRVLSVAAPSACRCRRCGREATVAVRAPDGLETPSCIATDDASHRESAYLLCQHQIDLLRKPLAPVL